MPKKKLTAQRGFTQPLQGAGFTHACPGLASAPLVARRGSRQAGFTHARPGQAGFTLIELMIATVLAATVTLGISMILADSQRGWQTMYNRIYSDIVTDGYAARRTFDTVMRKASGEKFFLDDDGSWIEVYYYADANSTFVDRYARFYCDESSQLNVEYGKLNPTETLANQTICGNVQGCVFKSTGRSAQMILTLDNGTQSATVVSSSFMHN